MNLEKAVSLVCYIDVIGSAKPIFIDGSKTLKQKY